MKTLFTTTIITIFISSLAFASHTLIIHKRGGATDSLGVTTYYKTYYMHNNDLTIVRCKGKGVNEYVPTRARISSKVNNKNYAEAQIEAWVHTQINSGKKRGKNIKYPLAEDIKISWKGNLSNFKALKLKIIAPVIDFQPATN